MRLCQWVQESFAIYACRMCWLQLLCEACSPSLTGATHPKFSLIEENLSTSIFCHTTRPRRELLFASQDDVF